MEHTQTLPQQEQSSKTRNIVLFIGMLVIFGLVAVMAANLSSVESTDLQNQKAPEFTLPMFDMFEQDEVKLSDLRGQVVVINFWASWCVECYKEAELLEQAWQDYKGQGVMFLGVDHLDTEKEALKYMQQYGITYPSGPDLGDKISQTYAITGVPETFFIDKDGNIAHVQIGPIERPALYALLEKLVAQQPASAQGS
ncbi:MAG: TlpA family protein disulfide reductase [Chloroflexi bacterium]|nr:MAG: TlpA family protein disulfide reductase [Chloroflexota bacterium]